MTCTNANRDKSPRKKRRSYKEDLERLTTKKANKQRKRKDRYEWE